MADCKRLLRYLDDSPPRRAELRWKTGGLGHLGGILESDASAGAAAAVQRTAAATGSLSTRPRHLTEQLNLLHLTSKYLFRIELKLKLYSVKPYTSEAFRLKAFSKRLLE